LEKQSTNIVFPSEDFSTTWSAINTTVTTNQATAPDGNTTADRISITSNGGYIRRFNLTTANSSTYTASVYVKNDTISAGNTFNFYFNNNLLPPNSAEGFATININSGTVTSSSGGSGISNVSASIESLINGWYRVNLTFTLGSLAGGNNCEIGFTASTATRTFFAYGAQLEASSYPTSYIPTTSASATRVADYTSRSGLALTNFTFAVNFKPLAYIVELFDFEKTGGGRMFYVAVTSTGSITFNAVSGGTIGAVGPVISKLQTCKLAFKLNASTSDLTVFINGSNIGTYTTNITTFGAFFGLQTFGYNPGTQIEQIAIFPSVLTDAECISLTTI
jgi:hypothetical protein